MFCEIYASRSFESSPRNVFNFIMFSNLYSFGFFKIFIPMVRALDRSNVISIYATGTIIPLREDSLKEC